MAEPNPYSVNRRHFLQSSSIAVALTAAGCSGGSSTSAGSDTNSETPTSSPTSTESSHSGISDGRVVDAHAVSTAHDAALEDTAFSLETVGTRTVLNPSEPTTDRQSLTVAVGPDHDQFVGRFERGDGTWDPAVVRPNFPADTDLYSDGETVWLDEGRSGDEPPRNRPLERRRFDFTRLGSIQTALEGATVEGRTRDDDGMAISLVRQFESSELPADGPERIRHRAHIRPDGHVRFLESTYKRNSPTRYVRLRHTFRALGETTVERPDWVTRATETNDGAN